MHGLKWPINFARIVQWQRRAGELGGVLRGTANCDRLTRGGAAVVCPLDVPPLHPSSLCSSSSSSRMNRSNETLVFGRPYPLPVEKRAVAWRQCEFAGGGAL